ncbi:MAG: phage portal protein [Snodgrassella sp.]|nr:phage portal protein [Snodgrassella sp.]
MADLQDTGFFRRILNAFRPQLKLGKGESFAAIDSASSVSGVMVTPEKALKLSAVWACINLRSGLVSTLPFALRTADKNIATEHPLYDIFRYAPNADMNPCEFWQALMTSIDIYGNAFAEIKRKGERIISLEVLDAARMKITRLQTGAVVYEYNEMDGTRKLPDRDVFHLKDFTMDGITGLSPLSYGAEILGLQMEANDTTAHDYKNRFKGRDVLVYRGTGQGGAPILNDEQRKKTRKWLQEFSEASAAGKTPILEGGFDLVNRSPSLSPIDAQLLESRLFGIEEICRCFSVPPQLIGHTSKSSSWASSYENTVLSFQAFVMVPKLARIEQTITRKLLSPAERKIYTPKFNTEGLLRASPANRASFYTSMVQNGIYSRNHVRDLEDLPAVEGGDELTVQLNMGTLNHAANETLKRQE